MDITVIDPFGNTITIPKKLVKTALSRSKLYEFQDGPDRVIQKPALLFSTNKTEVDNCKLKCEKHYFRCINWDETLLISVRKGNNGWIAYRCIFNPSVYQMAAIISISQQLI